ncbi:hypothetical protein AZE42_04652 [Rhizopogon vesiculosus]|uniref:Uncharacterized protein n=1 Tax=Rhizopogon vesiculosus TaxID=180088 RepID=A0A1J8PT66_9AGAM|nr:hypothetical protein AZE42_04652 [Rhizopogon vesiculosus]
MESFPVFFKVRAVTFTCILLISFLWTVLLSVEAYTRWDLADSCARSLVALLLLTNTTTILTLPFLLLLDFRVWLDAARILLLVTLQIGSAAAFTYWNPQIQCPDQTADQLGVCKLINIYTLMACWIVPAILVAYVSYFAVMIYCQSRIPVAVDSSEKPFSVDRPSMSPVMTDPEMAITRSSLSALNTRASLCPPRISSFDHLPFSQPTPNSVFSLRTTAPLSPASRAFHPAVLLPVAHLQSPNRHASLAQSFADSMNLAVQTDSAPCRSGRLSKPSPAAWCI